MFPSRKSRSRGPLISDSCKSPALRQFLFCCLFLFVVAAYWWNFEQRLAKLQPPDGSHSIVNQDDVLQKADLKLLYAWRSKFQKEWNIPLLIQVSRGLLELPPYPASTLYVGAGLMQKEAVIAVPPLVRKALGEGIRLELEENLALCLKKNVLKEGESADSLDFEAEERQKVQETLTSNAVTHCIETTLDTLWRSL